MSVVRMKVLRGYEQIYWKLIFRSKAKYVHSRMLSFLTGSDRFFFFNFSGMFRHLAKCYQRGGKYHIVVTKNESKGFDDLRIENSC